MNMIYSTFKHNLYHLITIAITISTNCVNGQDSTYFQQSVNYIIDVKLDDKEHVLTGKIKINYTNNSPDILDKIGMHLWPNAFSTKSTEFAKQKLLHRSTKYYDSEFEQSGNIKIFLLKVNGIDAKLNFVENNPDMSWLILPSPLPPSKAITIEAEYSVKIPESYSRLGHVDQSYQITQWYMKPAVYDHRGWHLMPYLDQGEFYSEFGDFEVKITIPKNYFVAATGTLQEDSEKELIKNRISETKNIIKKYDSSNANSNLKVQSSSEWKTITYKAENVHDFAWFADKTFLISKDKAILPSGKEIDVWTYYNDLKFWPKAIGFLKRSVEFYSTYVGEYPWPQASAVHSALSAGGGMEYPMITVINDVSSLRSLDVVVTHEVGHNWFYGILASNERDHPWMDEGINSYYEGRYKKEFHKKNFILNEAVKKFFEKVKIESQNQALYQLVSHLNLHQAPGLGSKEFTALNYGYDVYIRVPELLNYLEDYLGKDEMDRIMKTYYNQWKFKHPYPEDIRNVFKKYCPKDLDWLFDDIIIKNRTVDYSIQKINNNNDFYELKINNKEQVKAPIHIVAYKGDSVIEQKWIDGFTGDQTIQWKKIGQDRFAIDHKGNYFDYNQNNNSIRTKGVLKKTEPLKIGISSIYNNPERTDIMVYPSILWNYVNGFMLGLHVGRSILPSPQWNLQLSPKYAIKSKSLTGSAEVSYRKNFVNNCINFVKLGLATKRYGLNEGIKVEGTRHYLQIKPYVTIDFKANQTKAITSVFKYEIFYIKDQIEQASDVGNNFFLSNAANTVHKMSYYYSVPKLLGPYSIKFETYFEKYTSINPAQYLRLDVELMKSFRWMKKTYLDTRFFTSFFPVNSERSRSSIASRQDQSFIRGSVGAAYQSYHDYTNENNFLDRSSTASFWNQQIDIRQGGMKISPGIAQRTNLGNSNTFVSTFNLSSDLPIRIIGKMLRPYFDVAYVDVNKSLVNGSKILYSGGIQIKIIPQVFSFYFPVINSQNIREIYESDDNKSYWRQVTFSLVLNSNNLKDLVNLIQ